MQNSCSTSDFTATMERRLRKVRTKQCTTKSKHFSQNTKHDKSGNHLQKNHLKENPEYLGVWWPASPPKPSSMVLRQTGNSSDIRPCMQVRDHGHHGRFHCGFHCRRLADESRHWQWIAQTHASNSSGVSTGILEVLHWQISNRWHRSNYRVLCPQHDHTSQVWTSQVKDTFLNLTFHYVSSSRQLLSRYVDCIKLAPLQ